MPQISLSTARVSDPVLTTIAQGWQNAQLVFPALFPIVPVDVRGGKIVAFGREDFRQYNSARAPGQNTKRVQFGYSSSNFTLVDYSLEALVPFEQQQDASLVPGVDLGRVAVMKAQNIIQLGSEILAATAATTAASYQAANKVTLSGTSQWSDYSGTSNPSKDVQAGIGAIRAAVGLRANTVVMGPKVYDAVKFHPTVIDRIKYTGRDVATPDLLASLWGVDRVLVAEAVYEDASAAIQDVWGKFVVIAYTNTATLQDAGIPSYGYTYRLRGYPLVETPYQDRGAKSWIYPVTDSLAPVIASVNSGYLISAAVA